MTDITENGLEQNVRPTVLALDLEFTLISNSVSQIPRPGLYQFLEACRERWPRIVLFTTVPEDRVRPLVQRLAEEGSVPPWFAEVECVAWEGEVKDLRFIPGCKAKHCVLVDDVEGYVHPEQKGQWIPILPFEYPYSDRDAELMRILDQLTGLQYP